MRAPQHKPNDSTRIGTGQSSFRGRVRCQSLFIAGERRRCEPGSNSVIVTNTFNPVEGHVLRLGGVLRTRKIFVGCPAIRPIWDQSPGIRNPRLETVGNRLYPLHGQISLCRSAAEAQIQDRSRAKTGPNTAPGFLRVSNPTPQQRVPSPASNHPSPSQGEIKRGSRVRAQGGAGPPSFPRTRALQRAERPTRENKARHRTPLPCIPRSHRFARSRPLPQYLVQPSRDLRNLLFLANADVDLHDLGVGCVSRCGDCGVAVAEFLD